MTNEQLAREKALFKYTSALERGDFEVVTVVLQQAERDPLLEQMILEINEAYQVELDSEQLGPRSMLARRLTGGQLRRNLSALAAVVALIMVSGIIVLALLGPAVGSVFSNVVSSMPADYGGAYEPSGTGVPAGQPIPALAATATPAALLPGPEGTQMPTATLGGDAETDAPQPQERLIIKNGEMRLLVEDTDIAVDRISQIAIDNGGYVLSSQTWSVNEGKSGTVVIAVRAENFETTFRRLRDIALDVVQESSSGTDVSTEYVDLESRLRNLEATRDRMLTFLEQAATVDEALEVNKELAEIEAEIEQVKGRMTYLTGRAAFSTITIDLEMPQISPTPTVTPTPAAWSLNSSFESAAQTQIRTARTLLEAVTWIVVVPGPYLLVLGLVWWGVRVRRRRKKED
jgi:hypothetical protein